MKKRVKMMSKIAAIGILTILHFVSSITIANAGEAEEQEFKSVINKYDKNDLVIETGVSLKFGETLDLSKYPNWSLSNNEIVMIDENGILTPLKEGTVFLSQQIGEKAYVVEIYVSDDNGYAVPNNSNEEKKTQYKVFVDPGHGGSDSGAIGFGKNEDELNLEISMRIKQKLEAKGIQVKMSRTTDVFYTLSERAKFANQYGADVFISIHQNSATSNTATGIETYHHKDKINHKPLSSEVQTNAIKQTNARDRGVKSANFGVLRESNMPSALFESGFISTQSDYSNLANPTYQDNLATGIANGIETYLKNNIELDDTQNDIVIGTVTTDSLNVREGIGTQYKVIGTLAKGSKVEIVSTSNGWNKIKFNGGYGYVSATYVSIDKPQQVEQFTDIDKHWAKDDIIDFANKKYIDGYEDNTFRPNNNITRAEFVRVVNNVFGLSETEDIQFKDVKKSDWYYIDLAKAAKAGYISGYDDDTFRPNAKITREEAASIVANITKLSGDGFLEFIDANKIAPWAKSSVDALNDNNIMGGYEDNTFKPKENMTRAEAVATLGRIKK